MEIENKRILIVGGGGFVGSHVANLLAKEPVGEIVVFDKVIRQDKIAAGIGSGKVKVRQGDIGQTADIARAMENMDAVFHLAALPINSCVQMPRLCMDINVVGTFNVLEAARNAGVTKVIFSSASAVYGDTNDLMAEDHPLNARSLYGAAKIAGEYLLRAFHQMYGLDYVILRYMNVYGPQQDGGVVMAVLNRIRKNLPPIVYGDGSQSFDFVHVGDIARANLLALQSDVSDEAFNVGSGTEASIRDIVMLLLELSRSPLQPVFENSQQVLMQRRVGSSEKAKRLLGYTQKIELRTGLTEVIDSLEVKN